MTDNPPSTGPAGQVSLIDGLVNHILLPPDLPGFPEACIEQIEDSLRSRLQDATVTLRDSLRDDKFDDLRFILQTCGQINITGKVNKSNLVTAFRNLTRRTMLILHVTEQNTGLLIHRKESDDGDLVVFEAFEASPLSEKVLEAENALKWDFPGSAVAVKHAQFSNSSFQENIAGFLEKAGSECIKRFGAHVYKAGSTTFENRDTADPSLITGMFMTLLEANGHRICPKLLQKRVRDDVCWAQGGQKPWRRSAFWLVLRVGIERYLRDVYGDEEGRVHYKVLLCLVISQLLDDARGRITPERLMWLRAKLCRRLAKLEVDKARSTVTVRPVYHHLLETFSPVFRKAVDRANKYVESLWDDFKRRTLRRIEYLPRRAHDSDLTLSLPNSEAYLAEVINCHKSRSRQPASTNRRATAQPMPTKSTFMAFAERYYQLTDLESSATITLVPGESAALDPKAACLDLSRKLIHYLDTVSNAYECSPELQSIMLFHAMKLWTSMDIFATQAFPLLKEFNPSMAPDLLDALHLSSFADLVQLQQIQQYLAERWEACGRTHRTIFDEPVTEDCFATRYVVESEDSKDLQELLLRVQTIGEEKRKKKEEEWKRLSTEFEDLQRRISQIPCLFSADQFGVVVHDDRACTKCYLQRRARRIEIQAHEDPLPARIAEAKAMIFEFGCPEAFRVYRNATWVMVGVLGAPVPVAGVEPRLLLRDYSETKHVCPASGDGVTLASLTKSFLSTHYRGVRFPVDLESVCLPNGLRLRYYDTRTKQWTDQRRPPTFAHHCRINLPDNSHLLNLLRSFSNGPSSYEIIATQLECPPSLNSNEFMAIQNLFSGKARRWASILVELGSANLNFSTETTATVISYLASHVGQPDKERHPLRVVHKMFDDEAFCDRLIEQIKRRLDGIIANWREIHSMDMLLTLSLKLHSISPRCAQANQIVRRIRDITLEWTKQLRAEVHTATDGGKADQASKYALSAALLCRRTFNTFAEPGRSGNVHFLQPSALSTFIECSITMQDNMVGDPGMLPPGQRKWLIQDLKLVYGMREAIRDAISAYPLCLESAIDEVWPLPDGSLPRAYSNPEFLTGRGKWWVQLVIAATEHTREQIVHYHMLEGHLLVDQEPLGKLPPNHRQAVVLSRLFGKQNLLTYPSSLRGMTYTLALPMCGHVVHIGFRGGTIVIQAAYKDTIFEVIPQEIFGTPANFDLPAELIENCAHFLDLKTQVVEVRPGPSYWIRNRRHWKLDLRSRKAWRNNGSTLVNPQSLLFRKVARIFHRFEHPARVTVFQPRKYPLSVELRHLELSWFVNPKKLLECRQLKAEIDIDQDARTLYGLDSKLVLRGTLNPSRRSVLVPMGQPTCVRNQVHVAVSLEHTGSYGKFVINDVLGRLDCAAEPWLLFMKCQLHALTSFPVPDPLTGRTGTEEALHCLKSGFCQPWAPLGPGPIASLMAIAKLSPKREYYPAGAKHMQHTAWDSRLTVTIQHDAFWPAVAQILDKNNTLLLFALKDTERNPLEPSGEQVLCRRAYWRRILYQRPNSGLDMVKEPPDSVYEPRDQVKASHARSNVYEVVSLLRQWPSRIQTTSDLAGILQGWPKIEGFDKTFDMVILSDLLSLEFAAEWGPLANLCLKATQENLYTLMLLFAVIAFRGDIDMAVMRTLVAFAVLKDMKTVRAPTFASYTNFRQDQVPNVAYLKQLILPCCFPRPESTNDGFFLSHKSRRQREQYEQAYDREVERELTEFAEFLFAQWPTEEPTFEGRPALNLIDLPKVRAVAFPEWLRLYQNAQLSHFLKEVQQVLNGHHSTTIIESTKHDFPLQEAFSTRCRGGEIPTLSEDLFRKPGRRSIGLSRTNVVADGNPASQLQNMKLSSAESEAGQGPSSQVRELAGILEEMTFSQSAVERQYASDMMQSLEALKAAKYLPTHALAGFSAAQLSWDITIARRAVSELFQQLNHGFEHDDSRVDWLKGGLLWPCVTPVTLLEQLRSTSTTTFGDAKDCLLGYAVAITKLQRLLRLEDARAKGDELALEEELGNVGHTNWKPEDYPQWVLLEIDANFLIRPVQVDVAHAIIAPASGSNSVLQMNMGQGKTSCVMPMVAAELADSTKLLRLIVPKALLTQAAQLLQGRLGGLIGREVRHIPFSRKTPTDSATIRTYFDLHKGIMKSRGVILGLPEHVLSFKLSGVQRLSDKRVLEAKPMIKIQNWMQDVCRDVLDECDFTLATRTQLIYPSGAQTVVDGHPQRWEIAEKVLGLVESHLWNLEHDFPDSIEVIHKPQGRFPTVFFLRRDVEDAMLSRLVKDIVSDRTSIISLKDLPPSDRSAVKIFISSPEVPPTITRRIGELFPDNQSARQALYLLRGLLVHRILLLSLKKRWNVQYGLHPERDPIAVPFHAKGVPSDQAEWGHPDVAILFTILSFYCGGVEITQLRQCLDHLVKSDDPSAEYDRWTRNSNIPDVLRDWNLINVDDETQLENIHIHLRFQVVVIDYFLNHFVFPWHAKQFQVKLQASGWDIPLFSPGTRSSALTTGFSGTNDNKTMLPLTIKQDDLPALSHTNAEVLSSLLQERNRHYVVAKNQQGKHLSETEFLQLLHRMGIRVLIDAGAFILEMDNLALAKEWLKVFHEAPAVIYFDRDNKPFVLYRHGSEVPLLASPFAENLGDCLVYLDEAHTRGTDLKIPPDAAGALTLGLGQTKDHTVQAAMRLRQLATTQSIVFFSPPEVHQSIMDQRHPERIGQHVDSSDVIRWLLKQTCDGIEQIQPLYYSQGMDFAQRTQAILDNPRFLTDTTQRESYCEALRQVEKQTLSQLYKPPTKSKSKKVAAPGFFEPKIADIVKELKRRRKEFHDSGVAVHHSALQEVEQEREIATEIESVREVQKPVRFFALAFPGLHRDIKSFALTGRVPAGCAGFEPALAALSRTSLGHKHGIEQTAVVASKLFVSFEFLRTVKLPHGQQNDSLIRPVNWVVWSRVAEVALIVIPEEAEALIPLLRSLESANTHLMTYAAPSTRVMLHFNDLKYYAIPALPDTWKPPTWLTVELGILAGRVYFDFHEYEYLCQYLGVEASAGKAEANGKLDLGSPTLVSLDGVLQHPETPPNLDEPEHKVATFTAKPLVFLKDWISLRRTTDFGHTPMGYVCQSKPLTDDHPFFSKAEATEIPRRRPAASFSIGKSMDTWESESDVDFDEDAVEGCYGMAEEDEQDEDELSEDDGSSSE